jgi:Zn finger protein HypA/HybF involved in hydrogenase expression
MESDKLIEDSEHILIKANTIFEQSLLANSKKRRCLKCNRQFRSTSFGNRICPKCNWSIIGSIEYTPIKPPEPKQKKY